MVRGVIAPSCSNNQNYSIMKTTVKYIMRAICALLGMIAFLVLVGEPTDEVTLSECIFMKIVSLVIMWGAFKVYVCTLSERERRELEDEQI